jgi:hypothetical protein
VSLEGVPPDWVTLKADKGLLYVPCASAPGLLVSSLAARVGSDRRLTLRHKVRLAGGPGYPQNHGGCRRASPDGPDADSRDGAGPARLRHAIDEGIVLKQRVDSSEGGIQGTSGRSTSTRLRCRYARRIMAAPMRSLRLTSIQVRDPVSGLSRPAFASPRKPAGPLSTSSLPTPGASAPHARRDPMRADLGCRDTPAACPGSW